MRRTGIVFAIAGGILILGLAALWVLANPNRHRESIQAQLEKQLSRKVTLGEMRLGLLPLRFQVAVPVIAEDSSIAEQQQPFIEAEKLDVHVRLFPLLRGSIQVDSVELVRPKVEFVRTRNGSWNFSTLGPASAVASDSAGAAGNSTEFTLSRLTIADGQIGITDLQKNGSRSVYDHIDLTLLDYAPGKPFTFDLAAHLQGEGAQELRLKGQGGPLAAGNPADTPFQGTLSLNEVGIDGLMQFLDMKTVSQAKGVLSGQSEIANQLGAVASNGKLSLNQAQVNGLDIGYPIQIGYKLSAQVERSLVTIDNATLQLGDTPLSIAGSLDASATPMIVDLKIKSGDVSIAEVARLASAFGVAFAPGATVTGRFGADIAAKGSASKPVVTGTIAGRDLEISGPGIPLPVQVKAVDLALSPAAIRSNEFTATSGKTNVATRFSLLDYYSPSPSADVALRAPAATLPEILSIAKAYGITGLDQITGDGALNLDLRASGPLQTLNTASAVKALNGTIDLDFSPLKILGFDTIHELGTIAGFSAGLTEQQATEVVKLVGRILVKNGVAQTDNLLVQTTAGNVATTGTADLASETLNLKLSAVFSKAFSDKVGATRAGGLMSVAFSNAAGEIVLPAIVTGTFKQPKFAPDLRAVAELQKQRFIPSLNNPAGAIRNVLDVLKGKPESTNATPEQPEQPEEKKPSGIRGFLDALGGKKTEASK